MIKVVCVTKGNMRLCIYLYIIYVYLYIIYVYLLQRDVSIYELGVRDPSSLPVQPAPSTSLQDQLHTGWPPPQPSSASACIYLPAASGIAPRSDWQSWLRGCQM